MLHAISYLDFRSKFYEAKDPLYPDFDCFENRPNLLAWWNDAIQRPSVTSHYNVDFAGDDSAEFCQRNVQEVLETATTERPLIEHYYWPTPNGHKSAIMLEEVGLEYEVHPIDILKGEQFDPAFLKISPNHRIPAIVDTDGPGGRRYAVSNPAPF